MDIFFLQLAIILLPGLIWERIDTQFAQKRLPAQFDVLRRTFVFGLATYFWAGIICSNLWPIEARWLFLRICRTQKGRDVRDVEVFNFEGNGLFATPRVEIARPMDNIAIEFPAQIEGKPTALR